MAEGFAVNTRRVFDEVCNIVFKVGTELMVFSEIFHGSYALLG